MRSLSNSQLSSTKKLNNFNYICGCVKGRGSTVPGSRFSGCLPTQPVCVHRTGRQQAGKSTLIQRVCPKPALWLDNEPWATSFAVVRVPGNLTNTSPRCLGGCSNSAVQGWPLRAPVPRSLGEGGLASPASARAGFCASPCLQIALRFSPWRRKVWNDDFSSAF